MLTNKIFNASALIEMASLYRMTRVIHIDDGSEPYR